MADSTFTPTTNITPTYLGTTNSIETFNPATPLYDTRSTLNRKYGVGADRLPASHPRARYFGIGIGGRYNVDSGSLTAPHGVRDTNMDLYIPLPIRMVPLEQERSLDLSQYRVRRLFPLAGGTLVGYMLKLITASNNSVQYSTTDANGNEIAWTPDYSNLTPTPPAPTTNGVTAASSITVNAMYKTVLNVTGAEVLEAITNLYNGDTRQAMISEIGIYSGDDYTETATDATNTPFNYTESCMTQLAMHYCFNGYDLSLPTSTMAMNFDFTRGEIIFSS